MLHDNGGRTHFELRRRRIGSWTRAPGAAPDDEETSGGDSDWPMMGSYYREHVSFPNISSGPILYPDPPLALDIPLLDPNGPLPMYPAIIPARKCSVKGCQSDLPHDYTLKMCAACRERHRVYATTKRAKRKLEKALLTAQRDPVVWVPDNASTTPQDQQIPGPIIAQPDIPGPIIAQETAPFPPPVVAYNVRVHFDRCNLYPVCRFFAYRIRSICSSGSVSFTLRMLPPNSTRH